jgi:hypothetical protein
MNSMDRKTGVTFNRKKILTCESAICVNCEQIFPPADIKDWVDLNPSNIGQTALCPHCDVDGVIGYNGEVDTNWVANFRKHHFA